ncbi:hypothetical protein P73_4263 [Celeribacter indicus]|uniref:Uncharacterized protein n=2 Tax=Celeribacter indicus TaxID=1208324 RepID=A0A0B5DZT8_9RHOB|nr:hypothetical protein P73_4263 [Celeribacter indicus]
MIIAMTAAGLVLAGGLSPRAATADVGAYLAARQATIDRSFEDLSQYAERALVDDPENAALLEAVVSSELSMGNFDAAQQDAERLDTLEPGNQIAAMALLTRMAREDDFAAVIAALDDGKSISTVVDGMLRAWALVGEGDMSAALEIFDTQAAQVEGFEFFGPYNKALALALVGDFEGAEQTLSDPAMAPTRLSVLARAQVLSQLERNEEALALLDEAFGGAEDPGVEALRRTLEAGERAPFTVVRNARDGMADVFFAVASALDGGLDDAYTLLYARMAQELRPDQASYALAVASLLERLGRHALAAEAFAAIPPEDPAYPMAELGRANTLRASGQDEAELEVLRQLAKARPELASAQIALGDALRRHERYEEAVAAYSAAVDLTGEPTRSDWPLFFTRGIAHERLGQWEEAETDLRQALALQPDQPQVLNYLGYSFLEMKSNLDEAMDMIRKAAEARPQDGYITDSLGWGLYRLGRYEEAVDPMERAVALMPVDPIINDHLGDVYWAVGREREARFQWERALSFEPEDEDAERIRRKLDVGLDRVLIDEGEAPTRSPNDG